MVLLILLSTGDAKDSGRVTGFVQRHSCLTEKLVEALIFLFCPVNTHCQCDHALVHSHLHRSVALPAYHSLYSY